MNLSPEKLRAALKTRPFQFHDSTDSTNDDAMAWLRQGALAGSVVIADEQRKGRGRMGRFWYTPPGSALALSVILKPRVEELNRISMLGGLVVAELCEHLNIANVGIKYPNDVQIDGRKVCGVLPEVAWNNNRLIGVVLGMGVNVRVQFEGDLAQTATDIESALHQPVDRVPLVAYLLERIDYWSARLSDKALFDAWKRRLTTIGKPVSIGDVSGMAVDVDDRGALLVKTHSGVIETVIAGDVIISYG